jgi:hypothetical protein
MTVVKTTRERWCETEIYRVAGQIALMAPEPDAAKAEAHSSARSQSNVSSGQSRGNCARR